MGNYLWVLALIAAWRQTADDEPPGPQMARVDALAGQLQHQDTRAANDLAALLLVLVWFRWWIGAKWLANLIIIRSERLKTIANGRPVFKTLGRPETLDAGAFPLYSGSSQALCRPCQNDRLPIRHP